MRDYKTLDEVAFGYYEVNDCTDFKNELKQQGIKRIISIMKHTNIGIKKIERSNTKKFMVYFDNWEQFKKPSGITYQAIMVELIIFLDITDKELKDALDAIGETESGK